MCELELRYLFGFQVCQGRVLDYKRKFIEAASRYNELSYKTIIHEEERMTALKNAMICTILASAGKLIIPQKEFIGINCGNLIQNNCKRFVKLQLV